MAIGQLHGNLHGGDDQAVPHQQQVCETTCLWGIHLNYEVLFTCTKDGRLSAESPSASSEPSQKKKLLWFVQKNYFAWTKEFGRCIFSKISEATPPDVNQIMRTHIAVPCQIGINAGRGRGRIGQQLYLPDNSGDTKPEFHITPSMYCSLVKYLGFKYLCLFPFHLKLSINSSLIFFPHRTS